MTVTSLTTRPISKFSPLKASQIASTSLSHRQIVCGPKTHLFQNRTVQSSHQQLFNLQKRQIRLA